MATRADVQSARTAHVDALRSDSARTRWALRSLIALVLVYTCHRALVLRIEYYDGYQFLTNARAMLGDPLARERYDRLRPPLLSLLEIPAMLVVRASEPASLMRVIAPHCVGALVSLLTVAVVHWTFRRCLSPPFALLGTLLFVGGRFFVRYGAHSMADVLSAGSAAGTVAAYLAARDRRRLGAFAVAGAAFGAALLTKFPLVALGPALVAAEGWYALRAREFAWDRWLGLALVGAVGVAVFAAVQTAVFTAVFRGEELRVLFGTFGPTSFATNSKLADALPGEVWRDWVPMSIVMLGPTLVLAACGLAVALVQREDRDVPMLTWLVVLGGTIVFGIGHNEARYLLPVVPAIVYFAVRAVDAVVTPLSSPHRRRWSVRVATVGIVGVAFAPALHQAWVDRDPIFFSDVERRAALRMLQNRRPPGRLVWYRAWHTFATRNPLLVREDEYFNIFVFAPFVVEYFTDDRVVMPGGLWRVPPDDLVLDPAIGDGDAVLQAARMVYETRDLPPVGIPPVEVWQVRRMVFVRESDRLVTKMDPTSSLRLGTLRNGERTVEAEKDLGRWSTLAFSTTGSTRHRLADVTLRAGSAVPLGATSVNAEIDGLVLADVRRDVIR